MKSKAVVLTGMAVVALLQTFAIHAQNNRSGGQRASPNVTYQTATTKSGRSVILKSDGTWVYADAPSASEPNRPKTEGPTAATKPSPTRAKSTLSIKTGVSTYPGTVQPMPGTTFFLLDKDLESILRDGGFRPSSSPLYALAGDNVLSRFVMAWRFNDLDHDKVSFEQALKLIRPHVRAKTNTDSNGIGEIIGAAPGVYYLTAMYWFGNRGMVWSLRTNLTPGANSVMVNTENAALVGGGG